MPLTWGGHELLDVDRVAALDRDLGQLRILDLHILVLGDGIAFNHVVVFHDIAGDGIDPLPLEPVAGGAVQRVEADFFGGGDSSVVAMEALTKLSLRWPFQFDRGAMDSPGYAGTTLDIVARLIRVNSNVLRRS